MTKYDLTVNTLLDVPDRDRYRSRTITVRNESSNGGLTFRLTVPGYE